MKLHQKFKDEITIDDKTYQINATFDNILKVIKLLEDERVHVLARPSVGLKLLIGTDLNEEYEFDKQIEIFKLICGMYIDFEKPKVDVEGNPMPAAKSEHDQVLSYEQDAEYIYASFMQAYGIDLIDEQGKLHWNKFKALLNGLPKGTKVVEVVSIRSWKPSDDRKKRNVAMRELQKVYRLEREGED